ncbi:WXG100 family type VII secretion target [Amycolatopsis anabasis]|uniref:WXG100 family type VII secretion target n=1 Tax=Amycolatopsis anabasis TaxID=1840409 RepID=UPI001FE8C5A3|nr:hypothetical protein [Amycolatopsis anabasis]
MGKHSSEDIPPAGGDYPTDTGSVTAGSAVKLDNSETAGIVEQARNRSDGFQVGEDRAIVSPPNWASQESTQLYHGATTNNDPGTAESTGQAWTAHGKDLHQAANDLYNAISELGNVWVGQGAGAAQGTLVAIANSSAQAGEAAHSMGTRLAQQAAAAAEVKKMPAPKEFDPAKQTAAMLAGGPAAMIQDMKEQADAAKEVKAQQVAYFNAYTKAMSEVDSTTPSFGPESLGLPATASHNSVSGGPSVGGPGGVSAVNVGALGIAGAAGTHSAAAGGAGQAVQTGPQQPGFRGDLPVGGPADGVGSGIGSHAGQAVAHGGAGGANIAQGLGVGALGAGLGAAAGRTLGAGSRSGSKQTNETSAASDNQSGVGNSATANAPQQGVVPPSGTIGAGANPPPAGPPMTPMGAGAAGAQQQQEEEHTHASFLIEPDPDDAFGANQATPPPVIGAWTDDEED